MDNDPIYEFARSGNMDGLRSAVSDQNLDKKNSKGHSPLMLAAYNGHFEAAKFLLQLSADPDSKDPHGSTILMGVAYKGNVEIAKLLLRYGADPLAANDKNQTAIQFARMFGRKEIAETLDATKRFQMTEQISSWLMYLLPGRKGE